MATVAAEKSQAVADALAKVEDIKPAVTTEENEHLRQFSAALLQNALDSNKDNPHFKEYNFVQMPYAKLQNGSECPTDLLVANLFAPLTPGRL